MKIRKLVVSVLSAQMVRTLLTLGTGPIMSRLVGPVAYGVFAPAQSLSALGKLLADSGFAAHVITAKDLSDSEARALHSQSLRLALMLAVASGTVAAVIGDVPAWQRVLRGLMGAAFVLIAGYAAVPTAWNQRQGRLGRIEWLGIGALAFASFGLSVPLALAGWHLAAVGVNLIVPLLLSAGIAWRMSGLRQTVPTAVVVDRRFRTGVLGVNVASYLAVNADLLAVSVYMSTAAIGVYSRTELLASMPGNIVAATLSRIGLSAMANREDSRAPLRFLFKASLITLGAFGALIVLPLLQIDIPGIVFGKRFASETTGFALLAANYAVSFTGAIQDTFHRARRDHVVVLLALTLQAAVSLGGLIVLQPSTLRGIGTTLLVGSTLRYIIVSIHTWRSVSKSSRTEHG